jgi:hypothetical protein
LGRPWPFGVFVIVKKMRKIGPWLLVAAAVIIARMATRKKETAPGGAATTPGTTSGVRGIRNNNPGNIRKGSKKIWLGEVWPSQDASFVQFMTMAYGVRALLIDLVNKHKQGLNTVQKIIYKYAPPTENYSARYAKFVADAMGLTVTEPFDMTQANLLKFAKAVARFENGNAAALINAQSWEEGMRRALARTDVAQYVENQ